MKGRDGMARTAQQARETTPRARLLRRLATLRNLEAGNILLFWLLFLLAWRGAASPSSWGFRTFALALVTLILAEGASYWHLKLRSLRAKRALPAGFRTNFHRLRILNLVLLAACVPVAALLYALGLSSALDLVLGALLAAFAGLEHVNYFHLQLMHDNRNDWAYLRRHRRLRRAPLADDLKGSD